MLYFDGPSLLTGITLGGQRYIGALFLAVGDHIKFVELVGIKGSPFTCSVAHFHQMHCAIYYLDTTLSTKPTFIASALRNSLRVMYAFLRFFLIPTRDAKAAYEAVRYVNYQLEQVRMKTGTATNTDAMRILDGYGLTEWAVSMSHLCKSRTNSF